MNFEDEQLRASFSSDFRVEALDLKQEFEGTRSLAEAAEMAVILKGLTTSLPFLPV